MDADATKGNALSTHIPPKLLGGQGTPKSPKLYAGLPDPAREQWRRYFSFSSEGRLTTGTITNVVFHLDKSPLDAWPSIQDFNIWQNSFDHYYSGPIGELEGRTFRLTERTVSADYRVVRSIPPYLIVIEQIVTDEGPLAGMGGFMTFSLNESVTGTLATILMQHDRSTTDLSEDEALAYWTDSATENLRKWKDFFIPSLRKAISR